MSTNEAWMLYAHTRDSCIELLRSLSPEQGATRVPLSPRWTVKDVASHVCGLNAEVAAGRRVGLGTDVRTAQQVADRVGYSMDEICDEWIAHESPMQEAIDDDPFFGHRLAADLVLHVQDIRHALGLLIDSNDAGTIDAAHTYAPTIQRRLMERVGVDLDITLTDGSRFPSAGVAEGSSISLHATPYDFLRSVTGRRSRQQVEALDWTGDPSAALDEGLSPYGPIATHDVEV